MADLIQGDEKILYLKSNDVWVPIGCLTSNSLQEETEFISTTTRVSGGWETALPSGQSYSIEAEAFTTKDTGVLSYDDLRDIKRTRAEVEWKIEDATTTELGTGFISSIGETSEVGNLIVFSVSIIGSGLPIAFVDSEPPSRPYLNPFDSITSSGVSMNWDASTDDFGVVAYNIYRNGILHDVVGNVLTYIDVAIISGATYSYNVSALDAIGNESPLSNKRLTPPIPSIVEDYLLTESGANILTEASVPLTDE